MEPRLALLQPICSGPPPAGGRHRICAPPRMSAPLHGRGYCSLNHREMGPRQCKHSQSGGWQGRLCRPRRRRAARAKLPLLFKRPLLSWHPAPPLLIAAPATKPRPLLPAPASHRPFCNLHLQPHWGTQGVRVFTSSALPPAGSPALPCRRAAAQLAPVAPLPPAPMHGPATPAPAGPPAACAHSNQCRRACGLPRPHHPRCRMPQTQSCKLQFGHKSEEPRGARRAGGGALQRLVARACTCARGSAAELGKWGSRTGRTPCSPA